MMMIMADGSDGGSGDNNVEEDPCKRCPGPIIASFHFLLLCQISLARTIYVAELHQ